MSDECKHQRTKSISVLETGFVFECLDCGVKFSPPNRFPNECACGKPNHGQGKCEDCTCRGTLKVGEPHPASTNAYHYINSLSPEDLASVREAFASCAIENNRLAEICGETLRRILAKEPVSDRYLLGLAWTIQGLLGDM